MRTTVLLLGLSCVFVAMPAAAQNNCIGRDFCTPQASFFAPPLQDDRFGHSVAIDGNLAIVGAFRDNQCGASFENFGAAYVYRLSNSTWTQEAVLCPSDPAQEGQFGYSVAVQDNWAMVGHVSDSCAAGLGCGAVHLFRNVGTAWIEEDRLAPADLQAFAYFGGAIAVDGNWAAIGAEDTIYLFYFDGVSWIQRQKFFLPNFSANSLGRPLALSGGHLIVGANGRVHFYFLSAGTWVQNGFSEGLTNDALGRSVAMDGPYALAVSTNYNNCSGPYCGVVYRYRLEWYTWFFDGLMSIVDPLAHEFANEMPVAIEGDWAVLGQYSHVFHRDPDNTWSQLGRFGVPDCRVGWNSNPAIDGSRVLVGGFKGGTNAAFFFDLNQFGDDCNCDGQSDTCDVVVDLVGDCQENGVMDTCDIYEGTSVDCAGDLVPDECQPDCQPNGLEDSCDIAGGSLDCNANAIPDECELATFDCNQNGIPDDCDTTNETNIPSDCACVPSAMPQLEPGAAWKNRFLSFVPERTGHWKAIRATLSSLHHVDPPYTGAATVSFSAMEGQVRWVGPPAVYVESSTDSTPFFASTLQCEPYFQDWSTIDVLHVTGSAIVPSSSYAVQCISANCELDSAESYSSPLVIQTARWGDVAKPRAGAGDAGQPDFGDITAAVDKFKGNPLAKKKVYLKLSSSSATGEVLIYTDLSLAHVAAVVDAFKGLAYPYAIAGCP